MPLGLGAGIKAAVKRALPGLTATIADRRRSRIEARFADRSPSEVFSTIYREGLWGHHADGRPSSGRGSADAAVVDPYVAAVRRFLDTLERPFTLVDLGCGDFEVGKRIRDSCDRYIACDVVADLIDHHRVAYADEKTEFRVVDLVADPLPAGNVATIRQVLQHLSNAQVAQIVPKLMAFDTIIVTEHWPDSPFPPNMDKPIGPGIRVTRGSGVVLGEEPFAMPGFTAEEICSAPGEPGRIATMVWRRT